MKIVYGLFTALVLYGCSSAPVNTGVEKQEVFVPEEINLETIFHVRLDWEEKPKFFGYLDKRASVSTSGGPMYSGDAGLAGVFAQIVIQAAISNSVQKKRKETAQNRANQILTSYSDLIEAVDYSSLIEEINSYEAISQFALKQDTEQLNAVSHDVVVDLSPSYYLSSDEKSLMLLMGIQVHRRSSPDEIVFEQTVKAISKVLPSDQPKVDWRSGDPTRFKATINRLFAESLSLLLEDLIPHSDTNSVPQKTYKYFFGGENRYERASLIRQSCERIYIKNLKGNIVAIPRLDCDHLVPTNSIN